jgi:precorrin-4/cobalt-precorrin-4 C11-methyltransferase
VTIAGIGPGGSEALLTLEVSALLADADLVLYAGTMMAPRLRARVRGELVFGPGPTDETLRERVRAAVAQGRHVAWLEPGDPSLYSGEPGSFGSLSENCAWLRAHGIPFEIFPGVSSLHALTARLGLEHADPAAGTPLVIYAPGRDAPEVAEDRLRTLCAQRFPMALFLAVELLPKIVEIAAPHYGGDSRIVLGHKIGWPDERIVVSTLAEVLGVTDGRDLPRHTLVLLGPWHG